MAPIASKGKGSKPRERRSRSRGTTPSSAGLGPSNALTAYLDIPVADLSTKTGVTYDDILERLGTSTSVPDMATLQKLTSDLKMLFANAEKRGRACDRGMRELGPRKKRRWEEDRERERIEREKEEKEKIHRESMMDEDEDEVKDRKKKKKKDSKREERPLTHGAHAVARQDGLDEDMQDAPPLSPEQKKKASPSKIKKDTASATTGSPMSMPKSPSAKGASRPSSRASSEASSLSEHQPPVAPPVTHFETFGPDPTTFEDPTVYDIRDVRPGMTEEEIKEIYSVAVYPPDDLHDLTPGTPPDKDFSNAKPSNQVSANTFAAYIEPYFRPFTEEDLAFLRERGDRSTPFLIPRRGKRHYNEIWAEEDGGMQLDSPIQKFPPNQARGGIDSITDDVAETDQVSAGPLLSRLLNTMVFENRQPPTEKPQTNGISPTEEGGNSPPPPSPPLAPAAFIPDSLLPNWKNNPTTKLDYAQIDERLKQELRYIGFLPEDAEPDYDAHYDDEVAARLRLLQDRLRKQIIVNGARKRRIGEAVQQRLAYQEFSAIAEDLDGQVQTAYLKRTRTLSKSKKSTKKPGGAGGGSHPYPAAGVSRPGIGDAAKAVMEKRRRWNEAIKPIFDDGLGRVPKDSLFDDSTMADLLQKEREGLEEEEDE